MSYPWLGPTLIAMGHLLALPEDWYVGGSAKIRPQCVMAALDFLHNAMQDATPWPHVVPTVCGGIQIEWHTNCQNMEIEFMPDGRVGFLYDNGNKAESFDNDDVKNLAALHRLVRKLAERPKGVEDEH